MKRPEPSELLSAAEWLSTYEAGEGDEVGADCHKVAKWLRGLAEKKLQEETIIDSLIDEAAKQGQPISRESARIWWRRHGSKKVEKKEARKR